MRRAASLRSSMAYSTCLSSRRWREGGALSRRRRRGATPSPRRRRVTLTRHRSIFQKFQPGLGHDGTGLYGTLTAGTMRTMIERCEVVGRTHVDVGAADGKVLLGALSLGAAHVYGIEISGDGLQTKFEGMRDVLAQSHSMGASSARLACSIDICDLRGATVEAWLNEVFNESDDTEITVSAVWHGYVLYFDTPSR